MAWIDRVAAAVTEHSRVVVVGLVLVTAALGAGMGTIEQSASVGGVSGDSAVADAYGDVRRNFSARGTNTTVVLVAVRSGEGNALSRDSLVRSLRYQRALRTNATLNATLAEDRPTVGVANAVARAAIAAERRRAAPNADDPGGSPSDREPAATAAGDGPTAAATGPEEPPTLEAQITQLESMDDAAVTAVLERVLDPGRPTAASRVAYRLLPREYEPGSTTASGRLVVVTQETDGNVRTAAALGERVTGGQVAARSLAVAREGPEDYVVYSRGLVTHQQQKAIGDSLAVLGPLALVFVLLSLSVAYRDPVDVLLGLVGVGVVLVWTFGAVGWLGIPFGQTMIAVPILLVGLSVDYALHVVMRYREERRGRHEGSGATGVRAAVKRALTGVVPALTLVTATTAVGFLANLTSPMGSIQEFGAVTALGIVATLVVFGLFVPALKTMVAGALARQGWDWTPDPPGSSGRLRRLLGGGATAARCAPKAVLVLALLVSAAGALGATGLAVSSEQELFMADDPPEWTADLPAAVRPGEYYLKENRRRIYTAFQAPDKQGYVLVEGAVTDPTTLDRVATAGQVASRSDAVFAGPDGEPAVVTPVTAMGVAARRNATFNATLAAADTDGDGVPDRNLRAVYDAFYAAAPDLAARTVHRTDGGAYTALRVRVALVGTADRGAAVAALTDAAAVFEGVNDLEATATGQPVVSKELNDQLSTTMVESLAVTLAVVLGLLVVVFRLREGSGSLGAVTLVPVGFTVAWLLGTMALLDISISVVSSLVGGISVGLGVDYAIHVSERFAQERDAGVDTGTALVRTVTGTGGALASSAVTTAAGFGVLSFSLLPGLRQFGVILAVGIVYAFLASVYVQPSLLALWARYGPGETASATPTAPTADD